MPKSIQGNFSRYQFDSVAKMKLNNIKSGQIVETTGYYSRGDGGKSQYDILTSGEYSGTPDGFGDHTLANGNIAKLLINDVDVFVKSFGAKGDGTTDDSPAIQACTTFCCNNSFVMVINSVANKYMMRAGIITPDNTNFAIRGTGGGRASNATVDSQAASRLNYSPTDASTSMFTFGKQAQLDSQGVVYKTGADATQWNIFVIDTLGAGTATQSSAAGTLNIYNNSFTDCGGTCIMLGGETYGTIRDNNFQRIAQTVAINGKGEILFDGNHIQAQTNVSFTAGSGNADAFFYSEDTIVKFTNNVCAYSEDYRHYVYIKNSGGVTFTGNKSERPSQTAPTKHLLQVENETASICKTLLVESNQFVMSSVSGSSAGRMINIAGDNNAIYTFTLTSNTFSFPSGAGVNIPSVDCSVAAPRILSLNANFRESSDQPLVKYSDGHASLQTNFLGGVSGSSVKYITAQSLPFTILANQADTEIAFDYNNYGFLLSDSLRQILPVTLSVQCDANPADTVAFYYSRDSAKADKVELLSTERSGNTTADLRADYYLSPDQVADSTFKIRYDSGVLAGN